MNTLNENFFDLEESFLPTKATILLVEDDLIVADFLRRALKKCNYRVVYASSYDEALEAVRQGAPDAAVLDIRLGESRSGVDVARYLAICPFLSPSST